MRFLVLLMAILAMPYAWCGEFTIRLAAPGHEGQMVVMSRYDDLITMRTVRMAQEPAAAQVLLTGEVEGTQKIQLRIGDLIGDLFVRPGSELHVFFPQPDPRMQRTLSATARVALEFTDISPFDINALVSDLNERLDAFVAEDLATDETAGMQAVEIQRRSTQVPDTTVKRPPTLFVNPGWAAQRVDPFAYKLERFYADVDDPWFKQHLEYNIAGLMQGPRVKDRVLYERFLQDRPVLHDDPAYIRSIRSFFDGQLAMIAGLYGRRFDAAMAAGNVDSLHAVLAMNDFLQDPVLRELVLIEQLYTNIDQRLVNRTQAAHMLATVASNSTVEVHRRMAANMLWDITAMRAGSTLPRMLLQDLQGRPAGTTELMEGPLLIAVSASWCTYCELEITALERIAKEYDGVIPIVGISLDGSLDDVKRFARSRPHDKIRWLHAEAEQRLRDDLRIRTLPTFFLLQDGVLTHAPAPLPSAGLAEIFHKAKVQRERDGRIKFWDD